MQTANYFLITNHVNLENLGENNMKLGIIMGITGGILALLVGVITLGMAVFAGTVGGAMGSTRAVAGSGLVAIVSLGLPILSIVGGALAFKQPKAAVICMAIPAIALGVFGLGGIGEAGSGVLIILLPAILMGIGAISVLSGMRKETNNQASA